MHAVNEKSGALGVAMSRRTKLPMQQQSSFKAAKSAGKAISQSIEELSVSISQSKKRQKSVHIKKDSIVKNREMLAKYFKNSAKLNNNNKYGQMFEEVRLTKFKTRDQLLGYVQKNLEGEGDQYLFLEKIKEDTLALLEGEDLSSDDKKALKDLLNLANKSIKEVLNKNPTKILASLNVSNTVYKFIDIEPNKSAQGMLKFYYNAVVGYKDLADVLRYIQSNFDVQYMFDSIDFLLESTAADLSSPLISMQIVKLRVINEDIYKLRVLKDLYRKFSAMLEYMRRREEEDKEDDE